jgi:hypothetical protein
MRGRGSPYGCEEEPRPPHFLENRLTDVGEVVSLTRLQPIIPIRILILIPVTDKVNPRSIVRPEILGKLKSRVTSSGVELATFRLVA